MKQVTLTLTDQQLQAVLTAINETEIVRQRLSEEQIASIAEKLNQRIDIPFMKERKESKILTNIVRKVDSFLCEALPDEIYQLYQNSQDGLTDDEAKELAARISELATNVIDIPYLPRILEYKAINFIVGVIVNGMRKDWDIEKAKEEVEKMIIPEEEEVSKGEMIISG